jgi:dephospho-CoA kinase
VLQLRRIAITGGLASGKSLVTEHFRSLGATTVSCDSIVRELLSPQHPVGRKIVALLGNEIVKDGTLNRSLIADHIFRDPLLRKRVEEILHPAVWQAVAHAEARSPQDRLFVVEVPLLYETDKAPLFDATICVDASLEDSRRWHLERSGNAEDFDRREQAQTPREQKAMRADYIISNHGDREELLRAATALYTQLTQ